MVVGGWEQVQMHRSLSYLGPKNTYSTHHRTAFLNGTYVRPGAGGLLYSPRHRVGTDSHPTRLHGDSKAGLHLANPIHPSICSVSPSSDRSSD